MTMKHSPGPWAVSRLATPDYAPEFAIYSEANPGPTIARVFGENSEANAALFAVAPELLAIVEAFGRHTANPAALFPGMTRRIAAVLDSLT